MKDRIAPDQSILPISFLDRLQQGLQIIGAEEDLFASSPISSTATEPQVSCYMHSEGEIRKGMCITFINGMRNSFGEACSHVNYLHDLSPNLRIDGIYNHSNTLLGDIAEIALLNYRGKSPITEELLTHKWTCFYEENRDNPHAKLLHFCHSQGSLHTLNALMRLPKNIREYMIVVAIGPTRVIPKELCFNSYNFASKSDVVHLSEDLMAHMAASFDDLGTYQADLLYNLEKNKEELILLKPHKDAHGMDHSFQSPTFREKIENILREYDDCKGNYS